MQCSTFPPRTLGAGNVQLYHPELWGAGNVQLYHPELYHYYYIRRFLKQSTLMQKKNHTPTINTQLVHPLKNEYSKFLRGHERSRFNLEHYLNLGIGALCQMSSKLSKSGIAITLASSASVPALRSSTPGTLP